MAWWTFIFITAASGFWPATAQDQATQEALRRVLTFHASFDDGWQADFAQGDPHLYTAVERGNPWEIRQGNHTEGAARLVPGEGLTGQAVQFTRSPARWIFYQAASNVAYTAQSWSGAVSFWLRVDPDNDLAPGYCDPVQITPRAWNDAAFFVDFDKDGSPRDFRLGAFADLSVWKPFGRLVDDIPESERPLLPVRAPPFAKDTWTHVLFTWDRFNTGQTNGVATLYLNGRAQGTISGWNQQFTWTPQEQSRLLLGLNYIGWFDDLSCFSRSLQAEEVRWLHEQRGVLP